MIDNFKKISELISFNSEDEFYFIQILQRKKDNPGKINGSNNSSRLVKAYYISSVKQLFDFKDEMINLASIFNARVGINLNKRSFEKTAFNTLKKMAEQMHNKDYRNVRRAWNTSCGIHNSVDDRLWILDIDTDDSNKLLQVIKVVQHSQPFGTGKLVADIPSKSGRHLIVKSFNPEKLRSDHPDVEIHKNNPTNLYIP